MSMALIFHKNQDQGPTGPDRSEIFKSFSVLVQAGRDFLNFSGPGPVLDFQNLVGPGPTSFGPWIPDQDHKIL